MGGDNSVQAGGVDILKVTPNNIEILWSKRKMGKKKSLPG